MKQRMLAVLLVLCAVIGIALLIRLRQQRPLPHPFSSELDANLYNCTLQLSSRQDLEPDTAVCLFLEWNDWSHYTRIEIHPRQIFIEAIDHNRVARSWKADMPSMGGKSAALTVMRRGDQLGLLYDGKLLFYAPVPHAHGIKAGMTVDAGWSVEETVVEPLEPVMFADNFMRTADEPGSWAVQRGRWALQSSYDDDPRGNDERFAKTIYAQNPFAWVGKNGTGYALCTTGKPGWEHYTLAASIRPAGDGAVGLLVNMPDPRNGLLVRWSPANAREGGQLALYRVSGGRRSLLARSPGGYLPGQWYRLAVVSDLQQVHVLVDGSEYLSFKGEIPWRGGIGLYAEGKRGTVFDDITAYGRTLNVGLMEEARQFRLSQRILDDPEMKKWANDWEVAPRHPDIYLHQRSFTGDQRMVIHAAPSAEGNGEIEMALMSDGQRLVSGYRAVVQRSEDGRTRYALYRAGRCLARAKRPNLSADEVYSLRLCRVGGRLWLEVDGTAVVEARDDHPLAGERAMYRATGGFSQVQEAVVIGDNVLDYLFTDSPVDWVTDGTWEQSVRWACDARWSFFSGWSHGDCVLWHKKRFTSDHTFEVFIAPKMEYPDARVMYAQRYCGMGITICGDGHDPRSGYAGVFGAPDEQGNPNRRTVLLRQGKVVASVNLFLPAKDEVHKFWSHLQLVRHESTVEFWVDGRQVITFTDPLPLRDGVPAVWTTDNGLCIARARLYYTQPPQPRTDVQIALDSPIYPVWCDIGSTLSLAFANACASNGKPVSLHVTPRGVPAGEVAPSINGLRFSLAPKKVGVHWYQVYASEGKQQSPGFHLLLPVFNPVLKRDDSHALVLYRFAEGSGTVVHDRSPFSPALPINVPATASVQWLPRRGLRLLKPTMLATAAPARKLQVIAQKQACTIECWVAFDTLYPVTTPPVYWEGNIVSWQDAGNGSLRNFAYGYHSFSIVLGAVPGGDLQKFNPRNAWTPFNHIGLQHQVVTWNGDHTRFYVNGRLVEDKIYRWDTSNWSSDRPLTFGNEPDGQRPFLGTYYLLAIHDRALTEAEVLHNYQAGPAAK